MASDAVAVIDYGVGNLLSVRRALEHCGASVTVTGDPGAILSAARVVLPGVGAFANGMAELRSRKLDTVAREVAARGTPLLGICLGMQMLLEQSEEFGSTTGLGLIPGRVIPISSDSQGGPERKIPHIGWNTLMLAPRRRDWSGTALQRLRIDDAVYFLHSYTADPSDGADRVSDCLYGGLPVSAAIARGSVSGCQFHPEKSGEVGLNVLRAFLTDTLASNQFSDA
jgi:glutamine amidotransferase